jgi:hypothetical protein
MGTYGNIMLNVEAAQCLVGNALAYCRRDCMVTVEANLVIIQKLLEDPESVCTEYDWDDFK